MATSSFASWMLAQEARAMLTRLGRVKPFALVESMVPAAAVSSVALTAIDHHLDQGRRELSERINMFLSWLHSPEVRSASAEEQQRRFVLLRLRFNAVLTQFDLFADALTQRSENETGVWLSGLDAVAADALALPGYYRSPPAICYLDRGVGAAIRRARTRLPGGGENPVAIIRVPRERMVGSGIASSLVHEVGHQAAALLDLVSSLRGELRQQVGEIWRFWERWISEIVADFWSVARVGIASTMGLIGVVSLPSAFVFRVNLDDPHPIPWIRVKLSCAMGAALYPHPQWARLASLWESFYPRAGLKDDRQRLIAELEAGMPAFVDLLVHHRPKELHGASLIEAMAVDERQPGTLKGHYQRWLTNSREMYRASPSLVFAVIGQAKIENKIEPAEEGNVVAKLLTHWALRGALSPPVKASAPKHDLTLIQT